ncbi:MAG: hypothetical protein LBC18_00580 [Opitutaceae bacterium]|jgi:hypothetical protein|nr:hypothetical protein [Opitutaceae bacterium]
MKTATRLGLAGSALPLFYSILALFSLHLPLAVSQWLVHPVFLQGYFCAGHALVCAFFLLLYLEQRDARLRRAALSGLAAKICAVVATAIAWWWLAKRDGVWQGFPETLARARTALGLAAGAGMCGFFGLLFSQDAGRHWNRLSGAMKTGVLAGGLGAALSLVFMLCSFKGGVAFIISAKWGIAMRDAAGISSILYLVPPVASVCFFALLHWKQPRNHNDLSQTL